MIFRLLPINKMIAIPSIHIFYHSLQKKFMFLTHLSTLRETFLKSRQKMVSALHSLIKQRPTCKAKAGKAVSMVQKDAFFSARNAWENQITPMRFGPFPSAKKYDPSTYEVTELTLRGQKLIE